MSSPTFSREHTKAQNSIENLNETLDANLVPPAQENRYYSPTSSPPPITQKRSAQSHQVAGLDYFAPPRQSLRIDPTLTRERKDADASGFYPLYSPTTTEKLAIASLTSSLRSSPTLHSRSGRMSSFLNEHDYLGADAPGDPPPKRELEHIRERPSCGRSSSMKSLQQIHREGTLSTMRSHLGLIAEAPIMEGHDVHHHLTWSGIRVIMREPFAEFFGTFIMILFGDGSVAQVLLSGGEVGWGIGNYQSINWCWGLGVMLGVYTAGDSGAFLNPAVMFAFCLFRGFPWKRFPIYFIAQVLGAFAGSGVVYANYLNAINTYEGGHNRTVPGFSPNATAGIFSTYPQPFLSKASQFFSEFIASSILVFVIFALKDESNPGAMGKSGAGKFFPLALLFLIFGIGAAFGWETGYAINLARDFGPRLMSYAVGYGPGVWRAGGYYFWVPMVAPFLGCSFGGFLYDVFIYTGPESPINTPWWGFRDLFNGKRLGGDGRGAIQSELREKDIKEMV